MNDYSNDEEKLVSWFQENYKNILFGIVLGLTIGFGFNYYNDMKSDKQYELSLRYEQAVYEYDNGKNNPILELSDVLVREYPANIYTTMTNLYAAKIHYMNGNSEESKNKLYQIINNQTDTDLKSIATIRLARILISEKKYNDAEVIIKDYGNSVNNLLSIELLGDISMANNELDKAKTYYTNLLSKDLPPNKIKIIKNKLSLINDK